MCRTPARKAAEPSEGVTRKANPASMSANLAMQASDSVAEACVADTSASDVGISLARWGETGVIQFSEALSVAVGVITAGAGIRRVYGMNKLKLFEQIFDSSQKNDLLDERRGHG